MRETLVAERKDKGNVRVLYVVAQDRLGLYDYLTNHFSAEEEVQVILDRRRKDRRQSVGPHEPDRRRDTRRRVRVTDNYLRSLGYLIAH